MAPARQAIHRDLVPFWPPCINISLGDLVSQSARKRNRNHANRTAGSRAGEDRIGSIPDAAFDTGGIPVTYAPPSAGTITSSGLYTAPASITAPQVVAITATSVANPAQSSTAYVYLEPPTPQPLALSGVSPATVNLTPSQSQLFLPVGNPAVTWSSSSPSIGYLTQEGYYTAPRASVLSRL